MKKKLALLCASLVACSGFVGCGSTGGKMDISNVVIPTYEETDGLMITAYSGPTVANWSGVSRNVSTLTEEHMQKFVEAGFNGLLAVHEGGWSGGDTVYEKVRNTTEESVKDALIALELCEKYDVKYYVRDWSFYELTHYRDDLGDIDELDFYAEAMDIMMDDELAQNYFYSPAFAGNFGRDEPSASEFDNLKKQIELYYAALEEKGVEGEFILNLLPDYAAGAHLGGTLGSITYDEYINLYFEKLAPVLGYISYDYYPFLGDNIKGSYLRTSYLSNLELLARNCKETGTELRTFLQTGGDFTGLRDLTSIGDFRFQMYANLAFGARQITYYEYGTFKGQEEGEFGLINLQDGTYNYTYDLAKKVNHEAHALEDAYLTFNYDGIMCFNALPNGKINASFRPISQVMESHPRIADVKFTQDAIMTAFKDADNNDAFMLMNYTDPYFNLDNEVTVKFNDAKALLMYRLGEEVVVPLNSDGTYTFKLYPGEGRFIIPLK